jgi:chitinase
LQHSSYYDLNQCSTGDQNNCWDYCFGKEEQLATNLVSIINNQKFDGIDIDYEYCYDIAGTQSARCPQRSSLYTDVKAQTFLNDLTSKLRVKLDALQLTNGYNPGRYEVTHAPMDSDLTPSTSKYFQISKARHQDLDFLMPQFYNGVTRTQTDGVYGSPSYISAGALFSSLANDMFNLKPHKVVFGFCIATCTNWNINAVQAVTVLSGLKVYNSGQNSCNGGAFFWVASDDVGGAWSDTVVAEVKKTAGCSAGL